MAQELALRQVLLTARIAVRSAVLADGVGSSIPAAGARLPAPGTGVALGPPCLLCWGAEAPGFCLGLDGFKVVFSATLKGSLLSLLSEFRESCLPCTLREL